MPLPLASNFAEYIESSLRKIGSLFFKWIYKFFCICSQVFCFCRNAFKSCTLRHRQECWGWWWGRPRRLKDSSPRVSIVRCCRRIRCLNNVDSEVYLLLLMYPKLRSLSRHTTNPSSHSSSPPFHPRSLTAPSRSRQTMGTASAFPAASSSTSELKSWPKIQAEIPL